MLKPIRESLLILTNWMIQLGQDYMGLDAIGFDAMVIGFLVASSIKLRSQILRQNTK